MLKKLVSLILISIAIICSANAQSLKLPTAVDSKNLADVKAPDFNNHLPKIETRDLRAVEAERDRDAMIQDLLSYAHTFKGIRYVYGGTTPKGFDCSGFTGYVFRQFGYNLDRSSRGQAVQGKAVSKSEVEPGDILVFAGRGSKGVGHVGIAISMDPETGVVTFIHAACSTGITVSKTSEAYYAKRYLSARRVID